MEKMETSAAAIEDRIGGLVESVIPGDSVYLVEVVVRGRQGSRVVEVYLDSDGGMGVDELARYSREVGFLLEAEDLVKGKYRLDVSSPGADRPLRLPRQLPKHVGRTLAVRTESGEELKGVLKEASAGRLVLAGNGEDVALDFDRIQEAKVVLPW